MMLRISTHIERLLLVNDCVIIPDFGGFVLQTHPAFYVMSEHAFYPSHKEIVFNPTLNHNDGLLAQSYMETYEMDFSDAQDALKQDLEELKDALENQKQVSLGIIGSIYRNAEGALIFQPGRDTASYSVSSYGLTAFHLTPVESERKRQEAEKEALLSKQEENQQLRRAGRKVIYVPFNRTVLRIAGIAAAAVVGFFLISTPVKDVKQSSYTASFVPSEMLGKSLLSVGEDVNALPMPQVKDSVKARTVVSVQDTSATAVPESKKVEEQPKKADKATPAQATAPAASQSQSTTSTPATTTLAKVAKTVPVEKTSGKAYYIVIGSFNNEAQANQFISEIVPGECANAGIVESGDKIRVYAAKYENRKDAEAYMLQLRENEKYKNSWLFVSQ